jgi:hypothetical protein
MWISPIKGQISYASALHQVGHILGRPVHEHRTIQRETLTWQCAKGCALEWAKDMERTMSVRLRK